MGKKKIRMMPHTYSSSFHLSIFVRKKKVGIMLQFDLQYNVMIVPF